MAYLMYTDNYYLLTTLQVYIKVLNETWNSQKLNTSKNYVKFIIIYFSVGQLKEITWT